MADSKWGRDQHRQDQKIRDKERDFNVSDTSSQSYDFQSKYSKKENLTHRGFGDKKLSPKRKTYTQD